MSFSVKGVWCDVGRMPYAECFEWQRRIADKVIEGTSPPTLLLVEHDPVLTLGASFHTENLLFPVERYAELGIQVERTDRGGDVTYHGPNQLVAYPIFPLDVVGRDLHAWLRGLEEALIKTLAAFGLEGRRFPPHTGVWVGDRKVAAIGVKVRKWVSIHGIALNCNNDLSPFSWIVPCGIQGYGVTSLSKECSKDVSPSDVKPVFLEAVRSTFRLGLERIDASNLFELGLPNAQA